jgi:2-polyprenyl-3-methyl-5-hydroxy-6-metoxy-1,4-benzoquinol methylase
MGGLVPDLPLRVSAQKYGWLARVLLKIGNTPERADSWGTTPNYTLENALDYAKKTIPRFLERIEGKRVLDFGCGPGWQSVAMVKNGAASVHGVDIRDVWIQNGRALAERFNVADKVTFSRDIPGQFDVVVSLGSFEHFADPKTTLDQMLAALKTNGTLLISWAEPWFSHSGSHMVPFFGLRWINLYVPESVIMEARSYYRSDKARRYEDVEGGLNRMTVQRYERLIHESGAKVVESYLYPTRPLPVVVTKIPILRELLTSSCACVLEKR